MNPYPFSLLNHFTVPVAMLLLLYLRAITDPTRFCNARILLHEFDSQTIPIYHPMKRSSPTRRPPLKSNATPAPTNATPNSHPPPDSMKPPFSTLRLTS